jgi:DNA-binding NtrC family response regulator
MITAFGDEETHAEAKRFNAAAMIDKPFEMNVLLEQVRDILKQLNEPGERPQSE